SNDGLKLMPGMTATVSVEVRRRDDVLRVPAAAARFRPESAEAGASRTAAQRGGWRGEGGGPRGEGASGGGGPSRGEGAPRAGGGPGGESAGAAGGRPLFVAGPGGRPEPRPVKLGLSDGRYTEVVEGLREGDTVITGLRGAVATGPGARPNPGASTNPF